MTREEGRTQVRAVYRSLLQKDKRDAADLVARIAGMLDPDLKLTPASVDNSPPTDEDDAIYQQFIAQAGVER